MRARVVYESVFGNTEAAAAAIARGPAEFAEVESVDVAERARRRPTGSAARTPGQVTFDCLGGRGKTGG